MKARKYLFIATKLQRSRRKKSLNILKRDKNEINNVKGESNNIDNRNFLAALNVIVLAAASFETSCQFAYVDE